MPTVFVTQLPHRRDPDTRAWVPTVNLSPASEHGIVRVLMPPQAAFQQTHSLLSQLTQHLKGYSLKNGDSLVPLGDCVIIAAAVSILARQGPFAILRYDRIVKRYIRVVVEMPQERKN